jgi:hypothetical protein
MQLCQQKFFLKKRTAKRFKKRAKVFFLKKEQKDLKIDSKKIFIYI